MKCTIMFGAMLKKKFLLILFVLFLTIAALSFAYKGILITKEPSVIYFMIGKHYFNNNDFDNAVKYFKKATELNPDFAEAYHNLGISFYYNGNKEATINFLKKAIEIKEDYAKAHYSIALIYYEAKDFDGTILHLSTLTELEPDNPNAHFDLAVAYVDSFREKESSGNIVLSDLQDLKKAVEHYIKAEELKPGFPHALSNAKIVEDVISGYGQKI